MQKLNIFSQIIAVVFVFVVAGCESGGVERVKKANTFDGIVRLPKEQIDVFMEGQHPSRKYKVIKLFSEKNDVGREARIADVFVKRAKSIGADGIIINPPRGGGVDVGPFGANSTVSYTGIVFVYE